MKNVQKRIKSDRLLSSCIRIKKTRISRRSIIPSQVCFQLDPEMLSKIEAAQATNGNLVLEPQQLANLRYYTLINSAVTKQSNDLYPAESSLTFSTSYLFTQEQPEITVVRSVIDLEGKIEQRVQQDLWQNRQLLPRVIQAHHWLVWQILRQLPLKTRNNTSLIVWSLWFLIAIAITPLIWYFLPLHFVVKLIIVCGFYCLLKAYIQHFINKQFKAWILHQLSFGFLSNQTHKRQLGFHILSFLN